MTINYLSRSDTAETFRNSADSRNFRFKAQVSDVQHIRTISNME